MSELVLACVCVSRVWVYQGKAFVKLFSGIYFGGSGVLVRMSGGVQQRGQDSSTLVLLCQSVNGAPWLSFHLTLFL